MNLPRRILAFALPVAFAAPAHAGTAGPGITFEGLLQTDGYWYDNDTSSLDSDAGDGRNTDFGLRRAELALKGKGPGNIDWVLGYDAAGDGRFLDANLRYRFGGAGGRFVQVGQSKQPNGLEELSSSRSGDFVSKAMITNTFAVGRRLGIAYGQGSSDWTLTGSVFGRELGSGRARGGGYAVRGTSAPINRQGNVFGIGLSYANHDTDADALRWRARPDADFADRLVDTGALVDSDRVSTIGIEAFRIRGPFKLQGEYMRSRVDRHGAGNTDFTGNGGYASVVWNMTGDTWDNKGGVPAIALPTQPGRGLWQLGLRYDSIDLDDVGVHGGRMRSWTIGANWYWRSNFKFALDYVRATSERNGVRDNPGIVAARAQFHW